MGKGSSGEFANTFGDELKRKYADSGYGERTDASYSNGDESDAESELTLWRYYKRKP